MKLITSPKWLFALALSFFALAFSLPADAQKHNVSLSLQDASNGETIPFATVSITVKGNSAAKPTYMLTDADGKATFEKVRHGSYTLTAEMLGYRTLKQEFKLEDSDLDLGVLKMDVDVNVIDAATVTATGNPIIIKKDTIEYNASSFKISDDNMLVDLLKKLPGIEVESDGTITSGGETISKITIGGKTFFLDDPQLASQNIPAKLIEKVKVVKKKSEQAEFTGIDDGEEETIIDLTVQKGMMNGAFGNAMVGGGHDLPKDDNGNSDWRYQGAFMGGRFTDKSQISLILNGNNTNNRGFNDLAGNMMTSMGGGGMGRGGGMGGGWGRTNGILTSWMGGLNGNWDLLGDKMDLGGNYLYNGSKTDVLEDSYKETYLEDGSTLISDNDGFSNRRTDGHRIGIRLEHKFSENTSILFQPQFNIGSGNYTEFSQFNTKTLLNDVLNNTNEGFSNNSGDSRSMQTNGFFLFRQRLGIPGRTISANLTWNFSRNELDSWNQSITDTYDGAPDIINQRIDQTAISRSLGSRIVYTEPLGWNLYLEASYQYRWNQNNTEKLAFNSGAGFEYDAEEAWMKYLRDGETKDADYSNDILNRYINQSAGLALMYQEGKTRAQLGVSANPTKTHNETNGVSYDDNRVNWAPRAMLFYDFNDNSNLRLFYFGRSAQPSTSQLMPVLDNSNPLSMALGNPYLTPYFSHDVRSDLEYSNKQTFFTMRLHLEGSYTDDPIVSALWYENGVQYSMPVNGKDAYSGNARLMINAPIAKSNFSISNTSNVRYSRSGSYIGSADNIGVDKYFDADRTVFKYAEFHDNVDFSTAFTENSTQNLTVMDRLRGTYRSDYLEIVLGGRVRFSKPWYSLETANANATWANQIEGSFNWTVGQTGLELKTDAQYNWYRGYTTEQPSELVWNAQISKTILKKQATLALRAYDILDRAKNLTVTDASNYHSEVRNNTLGRYIMLSFTWRFGNFGKAGEQMLSRMGGGPGGRPPGSF